MSERAQPIICLASASPRRRELLKQIGVPHSIVSANVDETVLAHEPPSEYVLRMAKEKASAIWSRDQSLPVLAADTCVVLDGAIFGKPTSRDHALEMLTRLSDRTHEVLSAIALIDARGMAVRSSSSTVKFRKLSLSECAAYWDSGEPKDKAGAYAIQGFAAVFIESVSGSYSGVMGLPLFETAELLRSAGLPCWCRMPP
jgi:septum formation protein